MNYLITYAILTTAAIWCARREGRRFERQFRRDHQAAGGGRDKLDALIEATREKPHESYAWGPDADQPVPYELGDFALWQAEVEDQR